MKRAALALIIVLLITLLLTASVPSLKAASEAPQPQWSKTYGTYQAYSVIQTADGGYAITGVNETYGRGGYGGHKPLLIKTNSLGELEWGKTYGPEYGVRDIAYSVVQTEDLGYVLSGDSWLLKTNAQGNAQWNKTNESPWGNYTNGSVIQSNDSGFVYAGSIPGYWEVAVVLKTDKNNNLLWNKTFPASLGWSRAVSVVENTDGSFAVAGQKNGAWFTIIDSNGNLRLDQNYSELEGYFNSIAKTKDDEFVLAGGTWGGGVDGQGQGLLVKINSRGTIQWNKTYDNAPVSHFEFFSVVQTTDGGYIVAGRSALIKADASGDVIWKARFGEKGQVWAVSFIITNDGGFAVAGQMDDNVWLAKFAPESNSPPDGISPPFQTAWIVTAAVIVTATGIGLLVYFKKRKR